MPLPADAAGRSARDRGRYQAAARADRRVAAYADRYRGCAFCGLVSPVLPHMNLPQQHKQSDSVVPEQSQIRHQRVARPGSRARGAGGAALYGGVPAPRAEPGPTGWRQGVPGAGFPPVEPGDRGRLRCGDCTSSGLKPIDCGTIPTPALAYHAMAAGCAAIMITGSHIPSDRNGLKFYLPSGEISKADEAGILAALNDEAIPDTARCDGRRGVGGRRALCRTLCRLAAGRRAVRAADRRVRAFHRGA